MHSAKYRWNPEATVFDLKGVTVHETLQVVYSSLWVPSVPGQDKGTLYLQSRTPLASGCDAREVHKLEKKLRLTTTFP